VRTCIFASHVLVVSLQTARHRECTTCWGTTRWESRCNNQIGAIWIGWSHCFHNFLVGFVVNMCFWIAPWELRNRSFPCEAVIDNLPILPLREGMSTPEARRVPSGLARRAYRSKSPDDRCPNMQRLRMQSLLISLWLHVLFKSYLLPNASSKNYLPLKLLAHPSVHW
jgi:hypothetical protein